MTQNQQKPDLRKAFSDVLSKMGDFGIQETSFNEVIGKSTFLQVGEHQCTVHSAEILVGDYGPQLVLVWSDKEGASIKQYVSFTMEDRDTKETTYSRSYLSLIQCLIADVAFKLEYVKEIPRQAAEGKTTLVDGLVGMKANVVVAKGKKGYEVVEESGAFYVKDVKDGSVLISTPFQSISDAAIMAKEEGYSRAYNRVHYTKPDKEEVLKNEEALRKVMEVAKSSK